MGDHEDIDDCLSCQVVRDRPNRKLTMSQRGAFIKLLEKTGMVNASPEYTPMATTIKLSKEQCPSTKDSATMTAEQKAFRSVIASFIHFINWTRPDMSKAVTTLCRFMHNPGKTHIQALKRLLRYLAGSLDQGLVYDFGKNKSARSGCYGLYDAAHADCLDTRRSTLAYLFYLGGALISWHSKLHSLVTTSTNHSEYCAAAKAGREAKWLEKLFTFLRFEQFVKPIDLFSDSKGAIAMTYNPVNRAASKHIDLADHYARELVELHTITVTHLGTAEMTADALTKALGRPAFERHCRAMIGAVLF